MEWYRQLQFVAAVPMPPAMAEEFGTTVNGMWADPEALSADEVARAHRDGNRVLFSVPMIALTPRTYHEPANRHLLDEVCLDVQGTPSECGWYYWESEPVYAACIYSDAFRAYLMERCRDGVDQGRDVVNLDEIMTSVGLMSRDPRGCGFCARCLGRFRADLRATEDRELADGDDDALRAALAADDVLYARYRRFHDRAAFDLMVGFINELRAYAAEANPGFAVSANVAYLGNFVPRFGTLWGAMWGPHVEFVLMENDYRVERDGPHVILPRGKFTAWYRLGAAFHGTPTWICPSINVPRQLANEDHRRYHELMFLEAYTNGGRWGYYWWPGVDAETRRRATAPEPLKTSIAFLEAHRDLYEGTGSMNELAVLYLDGPIMRRPETHEKYLGLAQALAEAGYQFDVRFVGDGAFNPDDLDAASLRRYRAVLVPEGRDLGPAPAVALETYAREGGELVVYSPSPLDAALVRQEDGEMLGEVWRTYRDEDRERIAATVRGFASSRIESSDPSVNVVRWTAGDRQVLHLLDYAYDAATDAIAPATDVRLAVPWTGGAATCTVLAPGSEDRELTATIAGDVLVVEVPRVDPYAVLVVQEADAR